MPFGPEIIVSQANRLLTDSIGNWYKPYNGEFYAFAYSTDPLGQRNGCAKFTKELITQNPCYAILDNQFLKNVDIGSNYQLSMWVMGTGPVFGLHLGLSVIGNESPYSNVWASPTESDTWKQYTATIQISSTVQPGSWFLRFQPEIYEEVNSLYVNTLSFRKILPTKIDHLPLMGVQ